MKDFVKLLVSLLALGFYIFCVCHLINSAFVHVNLEALPHYILLYFLSSIGLTVSNLIVKAIEE